MFEKNRFTECADGFEISIQDNPLGYAEPGVSVECGFPNQVPEFLMEYMDRADDDTDPCDAVYGYVPYEAIWAELVRHGGVADDSPYKPYFLMKWAYEREADRVLELLKEIQRLEDLADDLDQEIVDNDKILAEHRKKFNIDLY